MFPRASTTNETFNPLHELLATWRSTVETELLERSRVAIGERMREHGIAFEGREWPVSLVPTVLAADELACVAAQAGLIRGALQQVIAHFLDEHRRGDLEGPLHRFFSPCARWWDLISSERRVTEAIQLMRYDAIREECGRWAVLENNTCCPGGTIHCAQVRDAWLQSPVGREATRKLALAAFAIERPDSFVRHMVRVAQDATGKDAPNLAICSYQGWYKNELASLQAQHRLLVEQGVVPGGDLLLCDATEVVCDGGAAYVRGHEVAIIYNKLDPLTINPASAELGGWMRAAASERVEFLNSLAAMYLTEAKRAVALVFDRAWQRSYDACQK